MRAGSTRGSTRSRSISNTQRSVRMTRRCTLASVVRAVAFGALLLATAAPAQAANSGFVSASGGQFVLNGRPLYFGGSNAHYLGPPPTLGAANYTDENMTMAQNPGFPACQALGVFADPGQAHSPP